MSIDTTLHEVIKDGGLVRIAPILGGHRERLVFSPPDVAMELDPDTASSIDPLNAGQLRAWLDGFTNRRHVTVGSDNNRTVDIEILNPKDDEV